MEELLRLIDLSKYYTTAQSVVVGVNCANLTFCRGEFVAITGESGSGKSTLSHVLGGIIPYESGEMLLRGKPTSHYDGQDWQRYRRDQISFISQNYGILPGVSVQENVRAALRLSGMTKAQAVAAAKPILEQVELWDLRRHRAGKLSSGQKQRLAIARALAKPAPILIADEPTGNLDDANSRKVMQLLALAARDRLVILVTHEFPEAEPFATRHIVLQDGKVTLDAPLRPANVPGETARPPREKKEPLSFFVSRLQLSGRPVWGSLLTFLLAVTAFAVFAFLGTFIMNLDDTFTRIYDPSTFPNGEKNRVVVVSPDGGPMTQADYEAILNTKYVTDLVPNGYISDVQYAYREGVDYDMKYSESINLVNGFHVTVAHTVVRENAPFAKVVPMLAQGEVEVRGRLPENFYEVLAASGEGLEIGQRVKLMLVSEKLWGRNQKLEITVTVTGITDYGTGLYFHNDVGRLFQQIIHGNNGTGYPFFLPDDVQTNREKAMEMTNGKLLPGQSPLDLSDEEMVPHANKAFQWGLTGWENQYASGKWNINDPQELVRLCLPTTKPWQDADGEVLEFLRDRTHDQDLVRLMVVSQNTFDRLTWNQASEQVSIHITDYAYADRVIEALSGQGYSAMSPYQFGSAKIDQEKAAQREQTLTICLATLAAVTVLLLVVLAAMFGGQMENYSILRDLGLVRPTARLSVLWQVLLFTLLGQAVALAAVGVCCWLEVDRVVALVRYLTLSKALLLSAVHLGLCLLGSLFVILSLDKRVFPLSRVKFDLAMDEEV